MISTEPNLSAGAVYDILKVVCAENGRTIDDLTPDVFTEAIVHLGQIAKAVAESGEKVKEPNESR